MKKILFILSILVAFAACDELEKYTLPITDDYHTDFTDPDDPESPEFVDPEASIYSGPSNGEVITNTNSVTFEWTGQKSGSVFIYMLENYDSDWHTPTNSTSVTYDNLDNKIYTFKIKERDSYGNEQTTATQVQFTIDVQEVVDQVELVFAETNMTMGYGNNFELAIIANNIDNLLGATVTVQFNTSYLSVNSVEEGDFFGTSALNAFWVDSDFSGGTIYFEISNLGQDNGVTGSGSLAIINFNAINYGTSTLTFKQAEISLRDYNNNSIYPENYGTCSITIN